jgi:hypothetical protein
VSEPRRFRLHRDHDVTGISGTGIVADGVLWPDGTASVRWRGEHPSIVFWDRGSVSVEHIHGHGGATRIVWLDVPDTPEADRKFTPRGFRDYLELVDRYGNTVTVRESSSAEADCVWIFCSKPDGDPTAPHLEVGHARQVRDALTEFIRDHEGDGHG